MEPNTLLRAIMAIEQAPLEDAEYALTLVNRVMTGRRKKAQAEGPENGVNEDSIEARAETVLRENGSPLTSEEIAEKINTRFGSENPKASVASALSRSMQKKPDSQFVRVRHGLFGLREWEDDEAGTEAPAS